jgi:two-component system sensor histidine kinase TtrS
LVCANRIQIGNNPPIIFTTEHNISDIKNAETKRRHAEDKSRQHLVELSHVSRLHTANEMATGIAHELNQPLSAINSFASAGLKYLQRANDKPTMLSEALQGISRQAMRAGDIIQQLRTYVQKESPQMTVADLNPLINEIMVLMQPNFKGQGIELHLELAEPLPKVMVSCIEIQQVLVNLVQNAVDAMQNSPSGFRHLLVSTGLVGETAVAVKVSDTGPGMNGETVEHIFEPFFTTKGNKGIGVGLSLSYSIIEAHGGTLAVKTEPGNGSSFSFTLKSVKDSNLSSLT